MTTTTTPIIADPVQTRAFLDGLHEAGYEMEIFHDRANSLYLVIASGQYFIMRAAPTVRQALERVSFCVAETRTLCVLTVMELVHHLGLLSSPYVVEEREEVAKWARSHTAEEFEAALVAVNAAEAGR